MATRWEPKAKAYALVLSNLQFKGLFPEKVPQCASIVKGCLYKSIAEQSSRQIIQVVALSP